MPSRTRAFAFTALGFVFVGLGIAGYVLPLMPGTIFMILALWSFSKANSRFEAWLLDHRLFGKSLRDWRHHRAMSVRTKRVAIATVWLSMFVSAVVLSNSWVSLGLVMLAIGLTVLLVTRRTRPPDA